MTFDLQATHLKSDLIYLKPLMANNFEELYLVASNPLIWEQHPNKDRYKRVVFENFFEGAIQSKGAFLVNGANNKKVIGSSRYYDLDEVTKSVVIGYTFLAKDYWGKYYNKALKTIMLDYVFQFIDTVLFYIGSSNFRSQKAIVKLGAVKIDEKQIEYYGEEQKLNFIYCIKKENWQKK